MTAVYGILFEPSHHEDQEGVLGSHVKRTFSNQSASKPSHTEGHVPISRYESRQREGAREQATPHRRERLV